MTDTVVYTERLGVTVEAVYCQILSRSPFETRLGTHPMPMRMASLYGASINAMVTVCEGCVGRRGEKELIRKGERKDVDKQAQVTKIYKGTMYAVDATAETARGVKSLLLASKVCLAGVQLAHGLRQGRAESSSHEGLH